MPLHGSSDRPVRGFGSLSMDLGDALAIRLRFRKSLLAAEEPQLPPSELAEAWTLVAASLSPIRDSHHHGWDVENSFSTKIQRRLASTVPPRPIVEMTFPEAFQKLEELCKDCQEAVRCVQLNMTSPQAYFVSTS